jgi:hypothetical protein
MHRSFRLHIGSTFSQAVFKHPTMQTQTFIYYIMDRTNQEQLMHARIYNKLIELQMLATKQMWKRSLYIVTEYGSTD